MQNIIRRSFTHGPGLDGCVVHYSVTPLLFLLWLILLLFILLFLVLLLFVLLLPHQEAAGSNKRERIFYGDNTVSVVDKGTDFTDRLNAVSDDYSTELTISAVHLSDNVMFICQVNGLAAGNAEAKTRLQVFGKICKNTPERFSMKGCPDSVLILDFSPISARKRTILNRIWLNAPIKSSPFCSSDSTLYDTVTMIHTLT